MTDACYRRLFVFGCATLLAAGAAVPAPGPTATFLPVKDNTLYENDGNASNGRGAHLFSGRTFSFGRRRAVFAFDIAGTVPAGSTVTSATLTLQVSATNGTSNLLRLHRLLADWGEGASDAGDPGGSGTSADPGDATWTFRFWPGSSWTTPGGDFVSTSSASTSVASTGVYSWGSTPAMVADVQSWLDNPAASFGWILIGNEAALGSAVRFESKDNPVDGLQPMLRIEVTGSSIPAGTVPDGAGVPGIPLTLAKAPSGQLALSWGASCLSTDTDYEVFEGTLGTFYTHRPLLCSTAGATSAVITPRDADRYYLIVPRSIFNEGSYGENSNNTDRPQGLGSCRPQAVAGCP